MDTGAPRPPGNLVTKTVQGEEREEVLVHFSWAPSNNVQEYTLQLNNNAVVRSLETNLTLLLPYGNYSTTLCTVNRCGKAACNNQPVFIPMPTVTPQQKATCGKDRRL